MYLIVIRNKPYYVEVSKRKNKKYDVYTDGKYLLSYGDNRYAHYYDQFGHYSHLNHLDSKRKKLFYARHGKTNDVNSGLFWSSRFLW